MSYFVNMSGLGAVSYGRGGLVASQWPSMGSLGADGDLCTAPFGGKGKMDGGRCMLDSCAPGFYPALDANSQMRCLKDSSSGGLGDNTLLYVLGGGALLLFLMSRGMGR